MEFVILNSNVIAALAFPTFTTILIAASSASSFLKDSKKEASNSEEREVTLAM
jgi:hypothetical protein